MIDLLKFMDYASYNNENIEGKRKKKEIKYKTPAINKEVKREGKALVSKGLQEFKELSSKNEQVLISQLDCFKNYIYDMRTKLVRNKVNNILNQFKRIPRSPTSMSSYKEFSQALVHYTDYYELVYKLDYAIE